MLQLVKIDNAVQCKILAICVVNLVGDAVGGWEVETGGETEEPRSWRHLKNRGGANGRPKGKLVKGGQRRTNGWRNFEKL